MSKYKYRKVPHFSDELERWYQMKYKEMPYDTYTYLRNRGASCEDASGLIQERMDDIWKEYRAEKRIQAENEKFHPAEEIPFTETEKDILDYLYKVQSESPIEIPPDYDIRGEQIELAFT